MTVRLNILSLHLLILCFSWACMPLQAQDLAFSEIDLDTAVYRALTQSMALDIASDETQSYYYQVKQARLYPNPAFSYEVESFAGHRNWRGWHHREEHYLYSQLFETAGKRKLRTQVASYQYYASLVGYNVSKLIILNRLNRAFIQVVAAQELLTVTHDQVKIAKEMLRIATKKVEAGKVSLIEENKALVAYSTTLIAVEKAEVDLKIAKKRLSLIWAQVCPDFEKAVFPFFQVQAPIPFEQCLTDLSNQAEIIQAMYQHLSAKKNWRLEKAIRIPDVTLQIGYKANYEERNQSLMAAVAVPLPIFNRNQGNIGRSYFELIKTGAQGRQLWLLLQSKLAISYEDLVRAYQESERIRTISLPAATQAFELAQKGYREGKFEYLDVLDAQRTLFEVKERYIQALVNYHTSQANIDYLNNQTD